jgi:carboxyl-terminal processing protease
MSALHRVGLALLIAAGCRSDAAEPPDPSKDAAAAESTASEAREGDEIDERLADLETRKFPLLVWAAHIVAREYFDKDRFDAREQLVSAVTFMGLQTPEFFAELDGDDLVVRVREKSQRFAIAELASIDDAADRLEEILVFTQSVLELEDEPLHELEYTAINGLFAPLDPHTILLTPEEHSDLGVRTRGRFGGIGAQIRAENRRIVVVKVLPGMPAETQGLEAGDVILEIDRVATVNMPGTEAQELLRGPVGVPVILKVRRGKKTLTLEIVRDTIKVDSVESELLPGGVAYLRITNFQENTGEQLQQALERLAARKGGAAPEPARALVLDLRGNSGGLLTQATAVVDELVDAGELVIVKSAEGSEIDAATEGLVVGPDVSVVALVDEESASASEIVSGGLKALGRAVVVGRSSFGKGTVQMIKPAAPYGRELALKVTVAEYRVAGDERIQGVGVIPDLVLHPVELSSIRGIARYFDEERFERLRERSRVAHLPSARHEVAATKDQEPIARLHYLWSDEVPEGLVSEVDGELPESLRDPEVRLAREVALAVRGVTEETALKKGVAEVAAKLREAEDLRIVDALRETGVDWSPTAAGKAADLVVKAKLQREAPIPAGEPFTLELEVENRGSEPVARVHAITDCVHDELDGIELLVGTVAPGDTASLKMNLHVMPWHTDFTDAIDIEVHAGDPDGTPDATTRVMFEVTGAERPALAYDWWIVDDPALVAAAPKREEPTPLPGETPFAVAGNGDGMLQPGERVLLAFVAKNDGAGKSPDVRAILRNLSGTQGLIEEGAITLGELLPGAEIGGAFGITVNPEADPALPFELELAIGDGRMRTRAQDKLRLRVLPETPAFVAGAQQIRVDGEGLRLYSGAHASANISLELEAGAVLDTVGTIGKWRVIEAGLKGRRLFVPSDLGTEIPGAAEAAHAVKPDLLRVAVVPPQLDLEAVPRVTSADAFELRATASHPRRVRDVVVLVRPPGPSQIDRKVHYVANPSTAGDGARSFAFHTDVPLAPGGNRVVVLVRDGDDVEQRHDVWVYREAP